jgi:prolyl-tRNA editing enzyme YbaK/EbsC (Cys-tRNA(Pro) deacylase)
VQEALSALGLQASVVELDRSARTAEEAATAVGCRVDQIAKSLVFRLRHSGRALLVITSGAHRVDEAAVATLVGEPLDKADATFVREQTGFAIGGVAPIGHARPLTTLIDAHLLTWPEIWAAAGHPNTVFRLTPADLVRITGGRVAAVK